MKSTPTTSNVKELFHTTITEQMVSLVNSECEIICILSNFKPSDFPILLSILHNTPMNYIKGKGKGKGKGGLPCRRLMAQV